MSLKEEREVMETLISRSPNSNLKYSPEFRKFCLRILFHSTAAYQELRKFFGNRLPTCRTIRRWLRCTDASPGITQAAIDEIAQKVAEYLAKGEKLYLCLMSDEMSMRKQVIWNPITKRFEGFPTNVNSNSEGPLPVAKDALFFMVVGPDFKLPVAYFLLNGLRAVDRAALNKEVIIAIRNTGAIIVSMTGDGLSANITVAKLLGADFNSNKPYFTFPSYPNEKIYVIFDPPHMLKLIRKYFAHHKLYYKNDQIKWELLEILARQQDNDNFEMGNMLSRAHINFKEAPMMVSLAAQTISNGVADALEQLCEDKYEDFIGCEATIKFLRLNNNVFDIQNFGKGKPSDHHFKQPLCEATIGKFRELFLEYEDFVNHLTVEEYQKRKNGRVAMRKPVLKSRSSVGFFGMLNNNKSILGIYTDYVENGPLDLFYNFQFSQDHLETYFSLIRGSLGWNNNPNEIQLKSAYRKLLVCMPYLSARNANCILNSSNVLTVSSAQQPSQPLQPSQPSFEHVEEIEIEVDIFHDLLNENINPYEKHLIAIAATNIEKKIYENISKRSLSACQDCLNVFSENLKIFDSFVAKKNRTKQYHQPCSSTVYIISACNLLIKRLESEPYVDIHVLAKTIFNRLDTEELYDSSLFNTHQNPTCRRNNLGHKEQFILDVLFEYLNLKSKKIGKRITIEEQNGRAIRKNLTRSILLAGQ